MSSGSLCRCGLTMHPEPPHPSAKGALLVCFHCDRPCPRGRHCDNCAALAISNEEKKP